MENKLFTAEEERLIKSMIRKQGGESINDDKAYKRFEYVLNNTRPNIRTRFINNIEYTCSTSNPPKNKYNQLAYFAVRMDEWVKLNFIIDVTKHGTMMFIPRHPDKDNKYIFTSKSDRVWTRDDFNNAFSDLENNPSEGERQ